MNPASNMCEYQTVIQHGENAEEIHMINLQSLHAGNYESSSGALTQITLFGAIVCTKS